ncbi:MAG: hypothetical protein IPF99_38345 [Deltaproteobacteria bacterium]|nr:hypothetical protein [Deltaproteobacteria bacterium]
METIERSSASRAARAFSMPSKGWIASLSSSVASAIGVTASIGAATSTAGGGAAASTGASGRLMARYWPVRRSRSRPSSMVMRALQRPSTGAACTVKAPSSER